MRRPVQNGSSGSTIEILVMLTFAGASALTLLALQPRRARNADPDPARSGEPEEAAEDER